jgi:hypothetical protein
MKMADNSEICFVCGTPRADMRDHVLFDCLFVPPRPSNLLTLPAHYRYQNKLQEEYFRNIAVGLGLDTSHTAHTLWEDKVYRSLQRNSPLHDSLVVYGNRAANSSRLETRSDQPIDHLSGRADHAIRPGFLCVHVYCPQLALSQIFVWRRWEES